MALQLVVAAVNVTVTVVVGAEATVWASPATVLGVKMLKILLSLSICPRDEMKNLYIAVVGLLSGVQMRLEAVFMA